jgi:hypothetical protein
MRQVSRTDALARAGQAEELRACLIQKLQKVVRREFDLFVSVFGGAVMDGDQSR